MGKKYIIELEETPFVQHFENGAWETIYRVKGFNNLVFDWNGLQMLTPYTEDSAYAHGYTEAESKYREIRDELEKQAYEKGVQDTKQHWVDAPRSCAYKLGYENGLNEAWEAARKICTNWVLPDSVLSKIFGKDKTIDDIMIENTASEAIATIRAYEQEKEIQVGDEVEAMAGNAVVIEVIDGGQTVRYMYPDTITGRNKACNVTRTGRHFPEIAEVLQKMKEAE